MAKGDGRDERGPGAGRPRGPDVLNELSGIKGALYATARRKRSHPILRRLTGIERRLGLREILTAPHPNRRQPRDAGRRRPAAFLVANW